MRPRSPLLASVAVLGAVAFAGCGSSSGSGGSATSVTSGSSGSGASEKIDVCTIITRADAEKVIGGPVEVQPPTGSEAAASGVCIYKASGGGTGVSLLQVRTYPGPQFYGEQAYTNTKAIHIAGTEKAFVRAVAGGETVDVHFVKDGTTGAINFTDTGGTAPSGARTKVEAVATKLAAAI